MRGAIDLTLVAGQLFDLAPERLLVSSGRADDPTGPAELAGPAVQPGGTTEWDTVDPSTGPAQSYRETVYDAMIVALSGRVFLDETVEATPEQVLRQVRTDRDVAPALSEFFAS